MLCGGLLTAWLFAIKYPYDNRTMATELLQNAHVIIYGALLLVPFKLFIKYKIENAILIIFFIANVFILGTANPIAHSSRNMLITHSFYTAIFLFIPAFLAILILLKEKKDSANQ